MHFLGVPIKVDPGHWQHAPIPRILGDVGRCSCWGAQCLGCQHKYPQHNVVNRVHRLGECCSGRVDAGTIYIYIYCNWSESYMNASLVTYIRYIYHTCFACLLICTYVSVSCKLCDRWWWLPSISMHDEYYFVPAARPWLIGWAYLQVYLKNANGNWLTSQTADVAGAASQLFQVSGQWQPSSLHK